MNPGLALAFSAAALMAASQVRFASALSDPVKLDTGHVSGCPEENGVRAFKGIPYAAPPVGPLRWKPPKPAAAWEGVRPCTGFGASCPQPEKSMLGPQNAVKGPMSEDCLFLNVWTPAKSAGDRLPVMVWIHGGGFSIGSGSEKTYQGEKLAARGVVVVTINYRLGIFGFFGHPLLSKESGNGVSGNYGFLDQVEALKWVRRNIAAFGGDPGCVTIFGESAGAVSVSDHLVCPLSKGLFHRAIAQSGSAMFRARILRGEGGGETVEAMGERLSRELGCKGCEDELAALRAKSPDELLAVSDPAVGLMSRGNRFGPAVDGWVFPRPPGEMFEKGETHPVPFITGSNADEGTMFLRNINVTRVNGYRIAVRMLFRDHASEALELFPARTAGDVPQAMNRLQTIASFTAPARAMCRAISAKKDSPPAWLYQFTRVPDTVLKSYGAFHGLEIAYVFGRLDAPGLNDSDRALSETMAAAWVRFARAGDPNGEGLPEWPAYSPETDAHMEFGDTVKTGFGLFRKECDFVDKFMKAEKR